MKINITQKNEALIELIIKQLWKDINQDYIDQETEVLSNAKEKGARKGKLKGVQKQLFLKNNQFSPKIHFYRGNGIIE